MTDYEKAINDLNKIISHYDLQNNKDIGAIPMPLKHVTLSVEALSLEDELMRLIKGFEVTQNRATARIEQCKYDLETNNLTDLDKDTIATAFTVLSHLLSRYYLTCSKRFFNGK